MVPRRFGDIGDLMSRLQTLPSLKRIYFSTRYEMYRPPDFLRPFVEMWAEKFNAIATVGTMPEFTLSLLMSHNLFGKSNSP
jgi:L-lysine 2,3-aminomutase